MPYTQVITVEGADEAALRDHIAQWHSNQAGVAPGYVGARVLAEASGRHLIEVDFASEEEARRNNERPETAAWAEGLQQLVSGQPSYQNLHEIYRTG